MSGSRHSERTPFRAALLSTLVGYAFSLCLSAAVVLLLAFELKPIRDLERAGSDLGMRIFTAWQATLDRDRPDAVRRGYVFIDVDPDACAFFVPRERGCGTDEAVPPALVLRFLEAIARVEPAVVVIDVAPPSRPNDRAAFLEAASEGPGPPVIAPLVADPTQFLGNLREPQDALLPPPFARGRLRLAPMIMHRDPVAADGMFRHYPSFALVGTRRMPTAPFLTAALAQGGEAARAVDCAFYRAEAGPACTAPAQLRIGASTYSLSGDWSEADSVPNRLFWTLPSLRTLSDADSVDLVFWSYRQLSADMDPNTGALDFSPDALRGRVVVFGSSAPEARDLHPTPLGVISGAEILVNATRSFLEFGAIPDRDSTTAGESAAQAFETFIAKARGALLPALMLFPAWWAAHALMHGAGRRRSVARLGAALAAAAILGAGLMAGVCIELVTLAGEIRASAIAGRPVDLLLPILALGLEAFAEAARAVLDGLERLLASVPGVLAALYSRIVSRVAALVGRR